MPAGKFGKLAPDLSRRSLSLSGILATAGDVPSAADFMADIRVWPMLLNDTLGDCAIVAPAHAVQGDTDYAQGSETLIPASAVLEAYKAVSGYVEGDPSTDVGCILQDVFDYWRKTGIGGHKILFFAKINAHDPVEVAKAIYHFGHVIYGFNVPQSAVDQFDRGESWHVIDQDGGIVGGHAVNVGTYAPGTSTAVSWAQTVLTTDEFWAKYADECWVLGTEDWISRTTGMTPTGLDLHGLGKEFADLTGEPNPFPDVPPDPVPVPPVDPPPPSVDAADQAVAPLIQLLAAHHWAHITKQRAKMLNDWLVAKGFQ